MKLLKKWWFWVIAVVLLFIIFSITGNKDNGNLNPDNTDVTTKQTTVTTTVKQTETTTETVTVVTTETTTPAQTTPAESIVSSYKEGTYKVGSDIAAGEYKVFSDNDIIDAYVEVAKDSTSTLDSISANALFKTFIYVTVSNGQYLKLRDCYAVPSADAPKFTPEEGVYADGMYKVGADIPEGEYKVKLNEKALLDVGYVEVGRDSTLTLESILSNEIFENTTYITVKDGQYLSLRDAIIENHD